jgi:hypothetical protein
MVDMKNRPGPMQMHGGIPADMIKERFGQPNFVNGKTIYFEPGTRKKMTQDEVVDAIKKELDELKVYKNKEDMLLKVRILASIMMTLDIFLKFSYWNYSRFASKDI